MPGQDEAELFDGPPEQPAPVRPAGGRPRLRRAERGQVGLQAPSLDELVPAEHRVRLVWAFAEQLDLSCSYARIKAVEGHPGHPPADPWVRLALWLYATIDGVGSARELARLWAEHLAFQWLCGGVSVHHKTLADFRVGHGELLERLLVDGFAALLQAGVARLERVAQDGMRVRAAAGAASFRRLSTLAMPACGRRAGAPGWARRSLPIPARRAADQRPRNVAPPRIASVGSMRRWRPPNSSARPARLGPSGMAAAGGAGRVAALNRRRQRGASLPARSRAPRPRTPRRG